MTGIPIDYRATFRTRTTQLSLWKSRHDYTEEHSRVTNILSHFPYKQPRDVQRELLLSLERAWRDHDVFVLNLPTAAGKTAIAETIARWSGATSVITPTNNLVQQYLREFPKMPKLFKADEYQCRQGGRSGKLSCARYRQMCGSGGKPGKACSGCPYTADLRRSKSQYSNTRGIYNYYIYMAHKLYRPTLVVDEAHNIINTIRELNTRKLWQHEVRYPDDLRSEADILSWLRSISSPGELERDILADFEAPEGGVPKYVLERTKEPFGKSRQWCDVILARPLSVSDAPPIFWPRGKVRKIVLMSATIDSNLDLSDLGLASRRVWTFNADSPIPAENRPIIREYVSNRTLSAGTLPIILPKLVGKLEELAGRHSGEKGIVHATYSMSRQLQFAGLSGRFRFHTAESARRSLKAWLESEGDDILVACGMTEGLDLAEDLARWQVIAKIPWPNLGNVAMRWMAESRPEWYAWQTIREVIQASGRVCRTPTDEGLTYILDPGIDRLLRDQPGLFPDWYTDAIRQQWRIDK